MDELTIGDKTYISSKVAAKVTGYAKDYIGQLCREGRVEARLVGRNWYVLEPSIREHRFGKDEDQLDTAQKTQKETETAPTNWQQPEYVTETPEFIPVLSLKPEPVEPLRSPVVANMQSAWHEWFMDKNKAPAEVFDETTKSNEEILTVEEVVPEETANEEQEIYAELVALKRIEDVELIEEEVPLKRIALTSMDLIDEEPQDEAEETTDEEPVFESRKGSLVTKLVLAFVALIAVSVAVIGTGHSGSLLKGKTGAILEASVYYLEGTSTYKRGI